MPTRPNQHLQRHSRASASEVETLRAELRAEKLAREAVERENRELRAEVARLNQKLEDVLQAQRRMEDFFQKQIRKLEKEVADRDEKLESANKQIAWFQKTYFDRKTEQAPVETEQAECAEAEVIESQPVTPGRGQQPGSRGHGRTDRSELQQEEETLEIADCVCGACGKAYRELNKTENSPLLEIVTLLTVTNFRRSMYVPACSCDGGKIRTAPPPAKLFERTTLGNSVWLHLIVQKFLFGIPTNRTLKDLSLKGLSLSQGTVTGGFKKIHELLDPLYERIRDHCRGEKYWCADETTWRVFSAGSHRWWLWMIASEDAVVYVLDPSRSKEVPTTFFAGSSGTLMTDRLASYKGLHDGITKAWCWVHVRRDFLRIYDGIKKLRPWAKVWLEEIAKLFVLAERRFALWASGRAFGEAWTNAQTELHAHLKSLEDRWQNELSSPTLHKEQKTALRSLKRHWPGLTVFISDPRIPLHNNRAERLLRNAVILRKNSFGSGAEWSGQFAAKLFSIFQTWLVNGLDPEALLLDFFDQSSKAGRAPPNPSMYLPWEMTEQRKLDFALPKSYQRPG